MDINKKQSAILFLERVGFSFFAESLGHVVTFSFPQNSVDSLDVLNAGELENQIKTFAEQNGIQPCAITMILAPSVVFEKDFENTIVTEKDEAVQRFLDTIPFDDLNVKLLTFPQGTRIITTNKNLSDAIKTSFEKIGSSLVSILPYEALNPAFGNVTGLNDQNALAIIKKLDSFKQSAFAAEPTKEIHNSEKPVEKKDEKKQPANKARIYAMAGILVVLLLVLAFLILRGGK